MPSQTVDFLYKVDAALAGLYVSLVSNVDGVTKYSATTTSDSAGKWTINPKPPAGTYALYTGAAQGVLTTLVDPDFVVDPFNDDGTAVFPKQVTISAGGLVVTAGGINVTAGGVNSTVAAGAGAAGAAFSAGLGALGASNPRVIFYDDVTNVSYVSYDAGAQTIFRATNPFVWQNVPTGVTRFSAGGTQLMSLSNAGLLTITAGLNINTGGLTIFAGGANITGATVVTGSLTSTGNLQGTNLVLTSAASIIVPGATGLYVNNNANTQTNAAVLDAGAFQVRASVDLLAAGQLQIGPTGGNASSIPLRSQQKALIVGTTLTALGAGAQTLTAAQLIGGEIEHTVTGAVADTFDTGANLDAAVANVATGDSFTCILTVIGAFTVTLTAAAGITLRGTAAVVGTAAGKVCVLTFRRTGASAWTVYAATGA